MASLLASPLLPTTHLAPFPPLLRHCHPRISLVPRASSSPPSPSSDSYPLPPLPLDSHPAPPECTFTFSPLNSLPPLALSIAPLLLDPSASWAMDGQFGILEGRSASLIHPIVMGSLFIYTLYAGYLGWQWRRVRTIQDEITVLKKGAKSAEEGAPPSPDELKIKELTEVRKGLLKGGYRDRHWNAGSLLLAFGVFEAVGGCVNTWIRTGMLFPGPHLFGGAGIAVLWALAASLVPEMQRGNDTARSVHIGLNSLNVLLFVSQIPTGWEIVEKVLEFTTWP